MTDADHFGRGHWRSAPCADCGEPVDVDEWALKRGAPVSHEPDECIANLRRAAATARATIAFLRARIAELEGR